MSIEDTDAYTMKSCRHLVKHCQGELPNGETAETVGEFVEVHANALKAMKQRSRTGRMALMMQLNDLAVKYPAPLKLASDDAEFSLQTQSSDPRLHPDMVAAKEIFQGTWIYE